MGVVRLFVRRMGGCGPLLMGVVRLFVPRKQVGTKLSLLPFSWGTVSAENPPLQQVRPLTKMWRTRCAHLLVVFIRMRCFSRKRS